MLFHEGTICWQIARLRVALKWPVARTAAHVERPHHYVNIVVSKYRAAVRAGLAVGDINRVTMNARLPEYAPREKGDETFDWESSTSSALKEVELLRAKGHARYEDVPHVEEPLWRALRGVPQAVDSAHAARDVLAAPA